MRLFILIIIAMTPINCVRVVLYRSLLGFKIGRHVKIGMFSLLDIRTVVMEEHAAIRGIGNIFLSVHRLEMAPYSRIGGPRFSMNLFRGTANKKDYPAACLRLGGCAIIELMHYMDICADVIIGDNVVIGGIRSVFMTHTLHLQEFKPIVIGDNVYVGSNCLFQMGTRIGARCVVGLGSVVVKSIHEEDALIGGSPAKVVREHFGYRAEDALALRRRPYYKDGELVLPDARS